MKPHVHDAGDGWFYHLGSTCKQTFCFLAAHLIVGSMFVEGLVRFSVYEYVSGSITLHARIAQCQYSTVMTICLLVYLDFSITPLCTVLSFN